MTAVKHNATPGYEALLREAMESLGEIIAACDRCETRESASLIDEFTAEMEDRARATLARIKEAVG